MEDKKIESKFLFEMTPIFLQFFYFTQTTFSGDRDSAQVVRVANFAYQIFQKEGGDLEAIIIASLLHGIVDDAPEKAAKVAEKYFEIIKFFGKKREKVLQLIRGIDTGVEQGIVDDAVLLDWFTLSGFHRLLGRNGAVLGAITKAEETLDEAFAKLQNQTAKTIALQLREKFLDNFILKLKGENFLI